MAEKFAKIGNLYGIIGCMCRIIFFLTQTLYALNRVYYAYPKVAIERVMTFPIKPLNYASRINDILSHSGKEEVLQNLEKLKILIKEVIELAGPLYIPKFPKHL